MPRTVDNFSGPDNLVPTRRTLISRLRDWEDQDSWQEFFDTYWRLIYSVAVKSGLSNTEAEEVVQETVLSLAKKMDSFEYDRERCTFKGWLLHLTRLRIQDQYRKRHPDHQPLRWEGDETGRTATVERIPDPNGIALEQIWDEEWEQNLLQAAMDRVKVQIRSEHYQIFHMSVVQGYPPQEIARMLGANIGHVYLVRHRVAKRVRREKEELEAERKAREAARELGR